LRSQDTRVVCVCGGYGFPLGSASSARILMIGKTLLSAGVPFHVIHCGPSPVAVNTARSGVYDGISFEYTTVLNRPHNRIVRAFIYFHAIAGLTVRLLSLWPQRRRTLIHLYVMMGPLNLYVGWLCRLIGLPVSQELCEWWPGVDVCGRFTHWLHKRSMFVRATGVLVISTEIERRVQLKKQQVNPALVIHRLPAIVDFDRFASAAPAPGPATFTYCGTWLNDICFCIAALALVQRAGHAAKLTIVGGSAQHRDAIYKFAAEQGVAAEDIILTGPVDEAGLAGRYRSAAALLLPMRDDDQSRTRMPNKLAEYLASGKPVVAGNIGELTGLLSDGENAFLSEPGSEQDFARAMMDALTDPVRAARIGAAGQAACKQHLDYCAHADALAHFVHRCIHQHNSRGEKRSPNPNMTRIYLKFRNWFCGCIALCLIAAGFVRRARRRAMLPGTVTAVYFHNPSQRLFRRCVEWLERHGYTFISHTDLIEILARRKAAPPGAVWLSFDDGFRQLLDSVIPTLRDRGIPATLFVPTGIVRGDGMFPWLTHPRARDAITVAELQQIAASPGISLGSHTVGHQVTRDLPAPDLLFELSTSKRDLETWTGSPVCSFSYPVGLFDGREKDVLVHCGYQLAVTTENCFITPGTDPYFVPRFSVGDNITFPEAICNLVGVWRPAIDPLVRLLQFFGPAADPLWRASGTAAVRSHSAHTS
jgi:glycosyltransferase involved in cell wall biosynthesis/peptidoglycan/xylan/chitin deacetylase (PgdA/CDA1 family)